MGSRSLFSPYASSVNTSAARGIGSLFGPRLDINPELLALLGPGPEPTNEMFMATKPFIGKGGLFGSADKLASQANAQYLLPLIQAQFASNLAANKEKELIPFRSATELQHQKDLLTFKQQEEDKQKEIEQSQLGVDIGNVAANFPAEQMSNIIPMGATYQNPAEQARAYIARFGTKTPINEAVVQGDPRVIQANIGTEMGKEYLPLGSGDRFNPRTQQVIEGPSVSRENVTVPYLAGTEPYFDEKTGEVKQRPVYKEKTTYTERPSPATQYKLPDTITQEELDSIAKPSGANQSGQSIVAPPPAPNQDILNQLQTTLKQSNPINAQPAGPKESFGQSFLKNMKRYSTEMDALEEKIMGPKGKKVEETKPKERPKSYPFDYLIESKKLDKKQTEMFEYLIENYRKKEKKDPSLEEARTFIQMVIGNKNK